MSIVLFAYTYCMYLQVYSSGSDVKQRGVHLIVLNQGSVSTKGSTHGGGGTIVAVYVCSHARPDPIHRFHYCAMTRSAQ